MVGEDISVVSEGETTMLVAAVGKDGKVRPVGKDGKGRPQHYTECLVWVKVKLCQLVDL